MLLAMNPSFFLLPFLLFFHRSFASTSAPAPAPLPPPPPPPPFALESSTCPNGIGVIYSLQSVTRSFPILSSPADQPYAFSATLQIFNAGQEDLKGWQVFIGYVNKEILVSAGDALVADGSQLPANASQGITLTSPSTILKTGIDTALDYNQMGVTLTLKGTEFGQNGTSMPTNISLTNPGYSCSKANLTGTLVGTFSCFLSTLHVS